MATQEITRDLIRSLEPRDTPYEVHDARLTGLVLRIYPTGRMVYSVIYSRGKRETLGRADVMTPSDARAKATAVIADYGRGIDPAEKRRKERANTLTLRQYLDGDFTSYAKKAYRDPDAAIKRIKSSFPKLLDKRLSAIDADTVEKWRDQRIKDGCKITTLNRMLNPLKAAMRYASRRGGPLDANPLEGVKMERLEGQDKEPKARYLDEGEWRNLQDALDAREDRMRAERTSTNEWRAERGYDLLPSHQAGYVDHLKPAVLISVNTGVRRGELFGLRWRDIDLIGGKLWVRGENAKSGVTRYIPLNAQARATLVTMVESAAIAEGQRATKKQRAEIVAAWIKAHRNEYVFPGENGAKIQSLRWWWEHILRDAGIEEFRWHDMRHTFASWLVSDGVPLYVVQKLLGHAKPETTQIYAHLQVGRMEDAVALLDKRMR